MITSVFLTNNSIYAVLGNKAKSAIRVQQAYSAELMEGCLINGLITNEHDLKEQIAEFWNKHHLPKKGIQIVMSSSHFTIKELKVPAMNVKKTRDYIVREFTEVDNPAGSVYDYQLVSQERKTGMNRIMAVMADRELIDSHVRLFKELGIVLESIRPGRMAMIGMYKGVDALKGKTCLLEVLEGHDIHSALYVNGEYTYSSRARLFSARGNENFGVEIARSISGMLQFHDTLNNEQKISDVYFAGLQEGDIEYCRQGIDMLERGLSVQRIEDSFVTMPDDKSFSSYFFPVANLLDSGKNVNLVEVSKQSKQKNEKKEAIVKLIRPVIVITAVLAVVSAILLTMNYVKLRELNELLEYNTDPYNIQTYQEALLLEAEINGLASTLNQVQTFTDAKDSYPEATTEVIRIIQDAAGDTANVTINGYTAADGSLQFKAEAANAILINEFIDRLEATGLFENVEYSGYSMNGEEKQQYSINVICHLAADAGK